MWGTRSIHGRVYTWRSVHMEEECKHERLYTWKSVHTRGRLNREKYTQRRILAGEN